MIAAGLPVPTIRSLRQPGPVHPDRIDAFRTGCEALPFHLRPGLTLNNALSAPLVEAGFQSATVAFSGTIMHPFRYVLPAPAQDDTRVATFSAPHAPAGPIRIEHARASFGWADGAPFIHCHATWIEPDGRRRGGHILPHDTMVAAPGDATAWGFRTIRMEVRQDPETNFPLLQPFGHATTGAALVARLKPNQDILTSIETIAHAHGIRDAVIPGTLGSLIGARFTHGAQVDDHATEVLVRQGHICAGKAALHLLVADMRGEVHEGWLQHGQNPVCITFDLVLHQPDPPAHAAA